MKIFSLLIFISLISSFIFYVYDNTYCRPDYNQGAVSLTICSHVEKSFKGNECCMISYTDEEGDNYDVCIEFDAFMLTHYEQFKSEIKTFIHSYYPNAPYVSSLNNLYCSSKYIKFSFLALLLVLL